MPLNGKSPVYLHLLQNLSLITICIFFAPLCTLIAICSHSVSPYTGATKRIQHGRKQRTLLALTSPPRVILVTGVGMSKGLSIARAFYRQGHTVIGADFEPYGIPVCGRFSTAIRKFYRLQKSVIGSEAPAASKVYIDRLIEIIKREGVDLWVSCSGVASAMEDAEAAEVVEKETKCIAIQFGADITEKLHEKHSFIQQAQNFGLKVPETHFITAIDEAKAQLYSHKSSKVGIQFIMKSVGLDDSIRANMTLVPLASVEATRNYLSRLRPSPLRPFVLQEYIRGPEYCTHSIVVHGKVMAFTACPSAELLMHYKSLPPASALSKAMQEYTQIYAQKLGQITGHFSIDFMLKGGESDSDPTLRLYPIECNPRAHTAVVLFEGESKGMVDAYLAALEDDKTDKTEHFTIAIPSTITGYYWIGHDIISHLLIPFLNTLTLKSNLSSTLKSWSEFSKHVLYWKDGTYEIWDPWPFWCLYCIYWPAMFGSAILTRSWWSRCNVSTTKMFRC